MTDNEHLVHEAAFADSYPGCKLCRALQSGAIWIDVSEAVAPPTFEQIQAAWADLNEAGGTDLGPLSGSDIARIRARAAALQETWDRAVAEVASE